MKPYVKLNRLAEYLYTIEYTSFDYEYAYKFMHSRYAPKQAGACSAVYSDNGLFGKNFDWFYSTDVEFVVINRGGNYDTIGVAGAVPTLNKEFVESGEDSDMYKILPFLINDGMNNAGVFAGLNVVPSGDAGKTTGTNPTSTKPPVSAMMLPRYVLDRCGSAKEAVWTIQNLNIYCPHNDNLEEEVHLIVGDIHNQYLIEFINNKTVVIELTENKWITNYYRHGAEFLADGHLDWQTLTPHANGTHRSDIIADAFAGNTELYVDDLKVLMREKLAYTNMYTDNAWMDELCADYGAGSYGDLTQAVLHNNPSAFNAVYASAQTRYQNRERDDKKTWQTCHSNIYDIEALRLNVVVDEDGVEFDMDMTGSTKPVRKKVMAPCGGLELDETIFDVKEDVDGKKYLSLKNAGGTDIDEYLKKANIIDGSLVLTNKDDVQTVYEAPLKNAKIEDGKLIITKKDDTELEFEGGNVKVVHFEFRSAEAGVVYYDSDISQTEIRDGLEQGTVYLGLRGDTVFVTGRDWNFIDFNTPYISAGKICIDRLVWDNAVGAWRATTVYPEGSTVIALEYRADNRVYEVGKNARLHGEQVYAMAKGDSKKAVLLRDVTDGRVYNLTTLEDDGAKCIFSGTVYDEDDAGKPVLKFVEIHDDRNSYDTWTKSETILKNRETYTLNAIDNETYITPVGGSYYDLAKAYLDGKDTFVKLDGKYILNLVSVEGTGMPYVLTYSYVSYDYPQDANARAITFKLTFSFGSSYSGEITHTKIHDVVDGSNFAVIDNAIEHSHVTKYKVSTTYDDVWKAEGELDLVSHSATEIIFAGVLLGVNTADDTVEPEPVDVVVKIKSGVADPIIYVAEQKHHCVRIIDKDEATYANLMEAIEDAEVVYVRVNEPIQDDDSPSGYVLVKGLVPVFSYDTGYVICAGTLPAYEGGSNPLIYYTEEFVSFYNVQIRRQPNGSGTLNNFFKVDMAGKGKTFNATETEWRSGNCELASTEAYKDIKKACDDGMLNGINLSYYKYQEDEDAETLTTEFMWYDGTFTPASIPLMYFTNKHGDKLVVGYDEAQDIGTMEFVRVKNGTHEYNHAEDFAHLTDILLDYDYVYYQFGGTRQRIVDDQTVTDMYIGQLPYQQLYTNAGIRTVMFSGVVTGHKADSDTVINPYVVSVMFDEGATTERVVWADAEDEGMYVIYANVEDIASTEEAKHKGEVEEGDLDILFNQLPIKSPTVLYLKSEADENVLLKFWHIDNVSGKAIFQRQVGDYQGKVTIDQTTEEVVYIPFESTGELLVFNGRVDDMYGQYKDGTVVLTDGTIEDLLDAVQNNKRTVIRITSDMSTNLIIPCIYTGFGTADSGTLGISGNAHRFYGIVGDEFAPSVGVLLINLIYTEWNSQWNLIYQWRKTQNGTGIFSINYQDLGGDYYSSWSYHRLASRPTPWGDDYPLLNLTGVAVDDTLPYDQQVRLIGRIPMARDNKGVGFPAIFAGFVEGYSDVTTDAPTQFMAIVHLYEDDTKDIQLIPVSEEDSTVIVEVTEETDDAYKMTGETNDSVAQKFFEFSKPIRLSVTRLDGYKFSVNVGKSDSTSKLIEFPTIADGTFIIDGNKTDDSYVEWKENENESDTLVISGTLPVQYNSGTIYGDLAYKPYWTIDINSLTEKEKTKLEEGKYKAVRVELAKDMFHSGKVIVEAYGSGTLYYHSHGDEYQISFTKSGDEIIGGYVHQSYHLRTNVNIDERLDTQEKIDRAGGVLAGVYASNLKMNPSTVTLCVPNNVLPNEVEPSSYTFITYQNAGKQGLFRGVYRIDSGRTWDAYLEFVPNGDHYNLFYTFEETTEDTLYIGDVSIINIYNDNGQTQWHIPYSELPDGTKENFRDTRYKYITAILKEDPQHVNKGNFVARFTLVSDDPDSYPTYRANETTGEFVLYEYNENYLAVWSNYSAGIVWDSDISAEDSSSWCTMLYETKPPVVSIPIHNYYLPDSPTEDKTITFTRGADGKYHGIYSVWEPYGSYDSHSKKVKEWDVWINITKYRDVGNNLHYDLEHIFEERVEAEDKILTISPAQQVSYNDGTKGSDSFLPYWDIDLTTLTDEEKQKLSDGEYEEIRLCLSPDICHTGVIYISLYKLSDTYYISRDEDKYSAEFSKTDETVTSGKVKRYYYPDKPVYINVLMDNINTVNLVGGILANSYSSNIHRNPSIATITMRGSDLPPTGQDYDHVTFESAGQLGLYRGIYKARDGKLYNIWMKFVEDGSALKQFDVKFTYDEVIVNDEILYIKDELEPFYPAASAMYWSIDIAKLSDKDRTRLATNDYKTVILTLKSSYFNNHTVTLSFNKDMNTMNYYSSTSPVYKIVTSGAPLAYARVCFECSARDTIYIPTLNINDDEEMKALNYSIMTGGLSDMPARVVAQVVNYPASWGTTEPPSVVFNRYEFLKYRGECEHEGEMYDVYLIKEASGWTVNFVKQEKSKCKTFVLDTPIACYYGSGNNPYWSAKAVIDTIASEIMEYNNKGWEHRIIFKAVENDRFHVGTHHDTLIFDRCSFEPDVKRIRYYNDGGLDELEIVYTDSGISSAIITRRYTPEEIVYLDKSYMSSDSSYSPEFVKMLELIAGTAMPTINIKLKASDLVGSEVTPDIELSVNLEPQINTSASDTSVRTVWIGHVTYADKNYKVEVNNKLYGNLQCIITEEVNEEEIRTVFHVFEISADASEPHTVMLKGDTISDVRRCLEKGYSPIFITDKFANDVLVYPYIAPISFGARTFATNGKNIQGDVYNIEAISERGDKIYLAVETDKITVRANAEVDVNGMTFAVKESVVGTQAENSSVAKFFFDYLEGKKANIQLKRNNGDIVMLTGSTEPVIPPVMAGMNVWAIGFSGVDIDPIAGSVSDVLLELIKMEEISSGTVSYTHNIEVRARADSDTLVVPASKLRLPDKTIGIGSGTRLKIRNHALANGDVVLKLGGMEVFDGCEWHTVNGMDTVFVSSVNTLETDNKLQFNNANGEMFVMTINADGTGEVTEVNLNFGNTVLNIDGNYLTDTFEAERQAIAKFILETYTAGDVYSSVFPDFQNHIALGDLKELFGESEFMDDTTAVTLSSKRLHLDGEERVVYSGLAQNDNGENRIISVTFSKLAGDSEYSILYKCEPLTGEDNSLKTFVTSTAVARGYDTEGNAVWDAISAMASIKADVFKAIQEDKPHRIIFHRVANDMFHMGDYTPMIFEKSTSPYTYMDVNGNTLELTLNSATITEAVIKRKYTSNDDIYFDRYEMIMPDRVVDYTKRFNQMIKNLGYGSDTYNTAMPRASIEVWSGWFDEDDEEVVSFSVTLEPFANMSEPYDYLQMEWRGEVDCKGIKYFVTVDNKHELAGERILKLDYGKMEDSDCKVAYVTKDTPHSEVKALVDSGKQVYLKLKDTNYNSSEYEGITGATLEGVLPLVDSTDDVFFFNGDAIVYTGDFFYDGVIGYVITSSDADYEYENIDVFKDTGYRIIQIAKTPTSTTVAFDSYLEVSGQTLTLEHVYNYLTSSLNSHVTLADFVEQNAEGDVVHTFTGRLTGFDSSSDTYTFYDGTNKLLIKHDSGVYSVEYVEQESECNTFFATNTTPFSEIKQASEDGKEVFLKIDDNNFWFTSVPVLESERIIGTIPMLDISDAECLFAGEVLTIGHSNPAYIVCCIKPDDTFAYVSDFIDLVPTFMSNIIRINKTPSATTVEENVWLKDMKMALTLENTYNQLASVNRIHTLSFYEYDASNTLIHEFTGKLNGYDSASMAYVFTDGNAKVLIKKTGTTYSVEYVQDTSKCYEKLVIGSRDDFYWDTDYREFFSTSSFVNAQWAKDLAEAVANGAKPFVKMTLNLYDTPVGDWSKYEKNSLFVFDSNAGTSATFYDDKRNMLLVRYDPTTKLPTSANIQLNLKDEVVYEFSAERMIKHDDDFYPSYIENWFEQFDTLGQRDIALVVKGLAPFIAGGDYALDYVDDSVIVHPCEYENNPIYPTLTVWAKWSGCITLPTGKYSIILRVGIDESEGAPRARIDIERIVNDSIKLGKIRTVNWENFDRWNGECEGDYARLYSRLQPNPVHNPIVMKVQVKEHYDSIDDANEDARRLTNQLITNWVYANYESMDVFDFTINPSVFYEELLNYWSNVNGDQTGIRKYTFEAWLKSAPRRFKFVGAGVASYGETDRDDGGRLISNVPVFEWKDDRGNSILITDLDGNGDSPLIMFKFNNLVLPAGLDMATGRDATYQSEYPQEASGAHLFYWTLIDSSYNAAWMTGTETPNVEIQFDRISNIEEINQWMSVKLVGRSYIFDGVKPSEINNMSSLYSYMFSGMYYNQPLNVYGTETLFTLFAELITDTTYRQTGWDISSDKIDDLYRLRVNSNLPEWSIIPQ